VTNTYWVRQSLLSDDGERVLLGQVKNNYKQYVLLSVDGDQVKQIMSFNHIVNLKGISNGYIYFTGIDSENKTDYNFKTAQELVDSIVTRDADQYLRRVNISSGQDEFFIEKPISTYVFYKDKIYYIDPTDKPSSFKGNSAGKVVAKDQNTSREEQIIDEYVFGKLYITEEGIFTYANPVAKSYFNMFGTYLDVAITDGLTYFNFKGDKVRSINYGSYYVSNRLLYVNNKLYGISDSGDSLLEIKANNQFKEIKTFGSFISFDQSNDIKTGRIKTYDLVDKKLTTE